MPHLFFLIIDLSSPTLTPGILRRPYTARAECRAVISRCTFMLEPCLVKPIIATATDPSRERACMLCILGRVALPITGRPWDGVCAASSGKSIWRGEDTHLAWAEHDL